MAANGLATPISILNEIAMVFKSNGGRIATKNCNKFIDVS